MKNDTKPFLFACSITHYFLDAFQATKQLFKATNDRQNRQNETYNVNKRNV